MSKTFVVGEVLFDGLNRWLVKWKEQLCAMTTRIHLFSSVKSAISFCFQIALKVLPNWLRFYNSFCSPITLWSNNVRICLDVFERVKITKNKNKKTILFCFGKAYSFIGIEILDYICCSN